MSRREFQFVSGGSSKFWAIEMKGKAFDVTFGKIGTPGTTQTKSFADAAAATKAYDKLVAEKTAKGYVEIGGGSAPAKAAKKGAVAPAPSSVKGGSAKGAKAAKPAAATPLNELYFNTTKSPDDFKGLTTFIGQKVVKFKSVKTLKKVTGKVAFKIGVSWEDEDEDDNPHAFRALLTEFLASDAAPTVEGLVIGNWSLESNMPVAPSIKLLIENKERLPELRALFLGDIDRDECEVSWIQLTDLGPLLKAFPKLELLRVRGSQDLAFKAAKHETLRALAIECGGLPKEVVGQICKAKLPNLEYLELWLGDSSYGGNAKVNDLLPILKGTAFPKLKHLGLRNSEIVDDIAGVIVSAPVLKQLETLDLSLGTLTDTGGQALLKMPAKLKLKRLNLEHHFLTKPMMKELKKLPYTVNVADQREPDDWDDELHRYVSIGE